MVFQLKFDSIAPEEAIKGVSSQALRGFKMAKSQALQGTQPLYYFVGWAKDEETNEVKLYTAFPQAVHILARKKIEFYYSEKDECMVAKVNKVPRDFGNAAKEGQVCFYQEFEVNKPVTKRTRQALAKYCSQLRDLDLERNKLNEYYTTRKENLFKKEQDIKNRIFSTLQNNGCTTKRGRWYHRAVLVDKFRVFCKTVFSKPVLVLDLDIIQGLAKRFKKHKETLESTITLDTVEINAELYEKKIKNCLTPAERKKHCYEHYEVSEEKLSSVMPSLPYDIQRLLWEYQSPIDDEGNPYYTIHPQTHNAKNPECQECGGKFKKGTNVCKDCGLESFVEEKTKGKKKPAKGKKPKLTVIGDIDNVVTYRPKSTRKKRAE